MNLGRYVFVAAVAGLASITMRGRDFESRERVRIQAHFDSVLRALPTRDLSALNPSQRANRAALIRTLRAYRDAGRFPHNYDRAGVVPTFIDPRTDVRCAVGHLVESTGRGDIVRRVAAGDNHVYVVQLSADTAFRHWLTDNGLTLAEAAWIQMPYMRGPIEVDPRKPYVGNGPAVALAAGSVGLTAWNLVRNRHAERRVFSIGGVAVGAAGIIGGNLLLAGGSAAPDKAKAAIWTGLASTLTGAVTMLPVFHADPTKLQVSPTVSPSEGKEGMRFGMTASLRLSRGNP
jgi:hypothetical protein